MNYAELDSPLYHGSATLFTTIDLSQSAPKKDFGSGFYTTNDRGYESLATLVSCEKFDIVIGPVANDAMGLVLNQFIAGVYGDPFAAEAKKTAIRLLLTQKLHNQVFFGTENAASRLKFSEAYDVCVE